MSAMRSKDEILEERPINFERFEEGCLSAIAEALLDIRDILDERLQDLINKRED